MSKKKENMAKRNKEQLPYVTVHLSPSEQSALLNEPAELLLLYVVLSRLRDFETNIAGIKTKICDKTFKEQLEVSKKSGRKAWRPTTTQIQSWLKQLENLGLIKNQGNYVFFLPLAFAEKSVSGRFHQFHNQSFTRGFTKTENSNTLQNKGLNTHSDTEVSPEASPQVSPVLHTPQRLQNNTTVILKRDEQFLSTMPVDSLLRPFVNLLGERFGVSQVKTVKTMLMISRWVKAGVTLEQATLAVDAVDAKGKPDHPTYYEKAVLKAKEDFDKLSGEISHAANKPKPYVDHIAEAKRQIALLTQAE